MEIISIELRENSIFDGTIGEISGGIEGPLRWAGRAGVSRRANLPRALRRKDIYILQDDKSSEGPSRKIGA
jgi:hypothetical protein